MGLVRDIMIRSVITIEHDKTAKDVAVLFAEKGISSLVVVKEGKPIGLVTERDLARKVSTTDRKSAEVPLSEIMSANFRWVEPMTPIEDAVQKMLNKNVRRACGATGFRSCCSTPIWRRTGKTIAASRTICTAATKRIG